MIGKFSSKMNFGEKWLYKSSTSYRSRDGVICLMVEEANEAMDKNKDLKEGKNILTLTTKITEETNVLATIQYRFYEPDFPTNNFYLVCYRKASTYCSLRILFLPIHQVHILCQKHILVKLFTKLKLKMILFC